MQSRLQTRGRLSHITQGPHVTAAKCGKCQGVGGSMTPLCMVGISISRFPRTCIASVLTSRVRAPYGQRGGSPRARISAAGAAPDSRWAVRVPHKGRGRGLPCEQSASAQRSAISSPTSDSAGGSHIKSSSISSNTAATRCGSPRYHPRRSGA